MLAVHQCCCRFLWSSWLPIIVCRNVEMLAMFNAEHALKVLLFASDVLVGEFCCTTTISRMHSSAVLFRCLPLPFVASQTHLSPAPNSFGMARDGSATTSIFSAARHFTDEQAHQRARINGSLHLEYATCATKILSRMADETMPSNKHNRHTDNVQQGTKQRHKCEQKHQPNTLRPRAQQATQRTCNW